MKPLAGRVAIVTGGSRGIGRGCAIELGAAGATVYLTGRTLHEGDAPLPGSIESAAAAVDEAGGRGIAVACDHRDDAAVEALFARVAAEQGRLDVLVNNAFLIPPELTSGRKFWEVPLSNWDDMLDVGTRSAFVASALAARAMVPAKRGLIANISSSGAKKYAWHVCYGVGKAALDRLTADTAHELAPHGVAVVSLWPGLVLTERVARVRERMPGLAHVRGETPRFTGRAVAALAADPEPLRHTGKALAARDVALAYGFRDVDGSLPDGPLEERPIPPRD
ncbi:MAG TPA: SDR family NAD(P)-dependent oxidoreductase [Myxococcota bacterium]|nr:SDR family NAD(P)-dependent oxidoreductase [Myxococcota bacterium]